LLVIAEPHSAQPSLEITVVDGQHAEVTLTGEISVLLLRDLETLFADPRLQRTEHWMLNIRGVTQIELACAYALLRAVTRHSGTVTVCGARRAVLRTLRHAGLDRAAEIEE
jgi:anti-anti-sigma regulatory factor